MAGSHKKNQLRKEQTKRFHQHAPIGIVGTLVNSIILTIILWGKIAHYILFIWLAAIAIVSLLRYLLLHKYQRLSPFNTKYWDMMDIFGIALSGIVWGSAGVFLFPIDSITHQVFLAFVLGGMVAGAAGIFSTVMKAFLIYSLPTLLPIIIRFFIIGNEIHITMGAMTLFFLLMMYFTAKRVNSAFMEVQGLNLSLSEAKEKAEVINLELNQEVTERKKIEEELREHQEHLAEMVEERTDKLKAANTKLLMEITEHRRTEAERIRLITAIEHADETIIITDPEGQIQYANPAFVKITGYTIEETIGQYPNILNSGEQDELFYREMWQTILNGEIWRGRLINRKKDGTLYHEDASISPVYNEAGKIVNFVAVKRDITREVELENQLIQAEKIRAMGVLAGGIAHDFNNILTPIIGFAELAMVNVSKSSREHSNISEVLVAAQRARDLVQQILAFSNQGDEERKPMQLQPIVDETLKLLKASLPATIEIKYHMSEECGPVLANSTQMHQVIMNLCTNAYHAMRENGGILEISLVETEIGTSNLVSSLGMNHGKYLKLTVSDTGHGIDKKIIQQIFDPYFTTKTREDGTGLGLSLVHNIVESHDGRIFVDSEPNKGTTFHVYIPAIDSKSPEYKSLSTKMAPSGIEKILLVDDEEQITRVLQEILGMLGYEVTSYNSSLKALETFVSRSDDFDLVITDQTMPEITGVQLAQKLMNMRPDIPIILCTGFSELISERQAKAMGIREYISKPITRDHLAKTVRKVLDESRY